MWLSSIACLLLLAPLPSPALVIRDRPNTAHPTYRATRNGPSSMMASYAPTLENVPGRYVTAITVNDRDFRVAIDSGSTDLFLATPADFQYDSTGALPVEFQYAGGNVSGTTGFATVQLGDYSFSPQAFMNATSVGLKGIVDIGLDGLLGLAVGGNQTSDLARILGDPAGQPFLFNIFDQTPDQNNFMAISLSRTDDLEGSADASFTINELDPQYARIAAETPVPLFPGNNGRWSILVDAINVNGNFIPLTSNVPNAPNGSLVVLMDTGSPTASLPPDILYALYSHIPGASVGVQGDSIFFTLPCNTSAIITVVIGGLPYTIHPLDLTNIVTPLDDGSGTNFTLCVSTIQSMPGLSDLDGIFGDSFMRNVYSVFNFGDSVAKSPTGAATMQLLSQTTPREAVADVQNVRMKQLANAAPEFQGTFPDFIPAPPGSSRPTTDTVGANPVGSNSGSKGVHLSGAVTDSSASSDGTESDSRLRQYGVIIIGLLSGNLLIVLILAVIGVALYVKRNGTSGPSSRSAAYVPVKLREEAPRSSEALEEDRRYSD